MSKDSGHCCGLQGFDPATDSCPGCNKDWIKSLPGISAKDLVWKPPHYTVGGYEALDVIKAKLSPEEWRGAMKFNILKYLMRANYKGHHDQDCEKALFYTKELNDALENKEVKGTILATDEKQVREDGR